VLPGGQQVFCRLRNFWDIVSNQIGVAAIIISDPLTRTGQQTLSDSSTSPWPHVLAAHRGWLSSVIFARVRDHHAVEEVLQETALAASQHATPDDPTSVSKWLYRVAIRQAILYRRREGRNGKRIRSFAREVPEYDGTCPWQILAASEQADLVQQAMQHLTAGDCEILLLKYTEHWSCEEIAERLGVSRSAVKSRLLRARKNLRTELLKLHDFQEVK